MTNIVTLQEVTDHLRLDYDDGDESDLNGKIAAAESAVMTYLGWDELPETIPAQVKVATLNLIGWLYTNREGQNSSPVMFNFGYGYLPAGVTLLLFPYRNLVAL